MVATMTAEERVAHIREQIEGVSVLRKRVWTDEFWKKTKNNGNQIRIFKIYTTSTPLVIRPAPATATTPVQKQPAQLIIRKLRIKGLAVYKKWLLKTLLLYERNNL
jgi:hypothetical protein